jgi:N-sulfoglucosamine sulfohydrolase
MKTIVALAMVLASGLPAASAEDAAPDRLNFVIFIGDDISPDFGCYGHPTIQTPHVDALAADGVRFANAYLTAPSCSPSRTSLLTARYPHNTGGPELHMKRNPHLANLPQFPHELRKAGYYTALAGKAHFNGNARQLLRPHVSAGRRIGHRQLDPGAAGSRRRTSPSSCGSPRSTPTAHGTWTSTMGPHGPEDAVVPPYLVDGERTRTDLALYYNEVHRFDQRVGDVLAELKAEGVADHTVILVMGDNGRPFPRDKTWIFDGGIKTPLIFHWPGREFKKRVREPLVSSIDIAPDGILEMAGIDSRRPSRASASCR